MNKSSFDYTHFIVTHKDGYQRFAGLRGPESSERDAHFYIANLTKNADPHLFMTQHLPINQELVREYQ